MERSKDLAEQTRSLIDFLNVRQATISQQLKTITNGTTNTLKKRKSVTFLDHDNQPNTRVQIFSFSFFFYFFLTQTSSDSPKPCSILKKQEEFKNEERSLEPFVVNIPDNVSRIDIDQYLKNVKDQRRKGLNYSYNTDDDDDDDNEEKNEISETVERQYEPWNEVKI